MLKGQFTNKNIIYKNMLMKANGLAKILNSLIYKWKIRKKWKRKRKEEGEERKKDRTDLYLDNSNAFQKLSMHCNIAFAYIGDLHKGGVLRQRCML